MRTSARLRVAASFLVITIAAACGSDSTAPQSPESVARHFDSLYVQSAALGDTNDAYDARSLIMTFLEVPPALGASPSTINVTTANGVEHWKAFEFSEVYTSGDSGFAFLAYRESAAHTMIILEFNGDGTVNDGALITNDTLSADITDGSGSTSLTSTSSGCGAPSASLVNPQISGLQFSTCTLASFHTSLTLTTQTSADIDPALASISFNSASVNGVRFVDESSPSTLRRGLVVLHAARAMKRR